MRLTFRYALPEGGGTALLVDYATLHDGKAWEVYLKPYTPDARAVADQQALIDLWDEVVIPTFTFTR